EIARQMRLRDLAGLIVIDFIDMDENRNNRAVERKLKECLKYDRARIQVGRISHFGLLEMSRQRMRSGVLEGSTVICPHCSGTGLVRSVESMALHVLRSVEAEAVKGRAAAFTVKVPAEVAIYILNQKRANLLDVEERYGVSVYVEADATLAGSDHKIEPAEARALTRTRPAQGAINAESGYAEEEEPAAAEAEEETDDEEEEESESSARSSSDEKGDERGDGQRRRRRRRRRGGKRNGEVEARGDGEAHEHAEGHDDDDEHEAQEAADGEAPAPSHGDGEQLDADGQPRKRRRRGRRGGRRNRRRQDMDANGNPIEGAIANVDDDTILSDEAEEEFESSDVLAAADAPILLSYSRNGEGETEDDEETWDAEAAQEGAYTESTEDAAEAMGDEESESPDLPEAAGDEAEEEVSSAAPDMELAAAEIASPVAGETKPEADEPKAPAKRGWWQRR
ncbi:MAG: ribonuclease E/G, partial [Parvibaculum sp.]|nr:ribonuclease E/G [Parvibaculum sp.]